jgi:Protein of unknown function (DUF4236)
MGLSFRKRLKIAPGLWVNLNKGIPSVSLGEGPFTLNVGKRGVRTTESLRGTGLSASQQIPWQQRRVVQQAGVTKPRKRWGWWIFRGAGALCVAGASRKAASANGAPAAERAGHVAR